MENIEHTPGPWLIAEPSLCGTSCDVLNSDGSAIIASVGCAESLSDVHLIAAAPAMYAALKDLVKAGHGLTCHSKEWNAVHDSIMKAEGCPF